MVLLRLACTDLGEQRHTHDEGMHHTAVSCSLAQQQKCGWYFDDRVACGYDASKSRACPQLGYNNIIISVRQNGCQPELLSLSSFRGGLY